MTIRDGRVTVVVKDGLLTIDAECDPEIVEEILGAAWVTQQDRNREALAMASKPRVAGSPAGGEG